MHSVFRTLTAILLAAAGLCCAAPLSAQQTHVDEISVDTRATFHQRTIDGKYDTHFQGDYFNLHILGHLTDNLSFRVRQRLNKKIDDKNPFNATDFLWLKWQASERWSYTVGKQPILLGGYEIDSAPIDVYYYGAFTNALYQYYAFGISAHYSPAPNQVLTAQFCPSPISPAEQNSYSYNLHWNGRFNDVWRTLWSINYVEDEFHRMMNHIVLGNKFQFTKDFFLDLDLINRASLKQERFFFTDWTVIGTYDMNGDGNADLVMSGAATIVDMQGTYIGYYDGSVDTDENWHTIGFLNNSSEWVTTVGDLTGSIGKNSIVWYSPEYYALGIWKDGQEDWVSLSSSFGGDAWTLAGCGDFNGDGKDAVLMSLNNGTQFYTVDINGKTLAIGSANWSGWEVGAIGDFAGDGKDDIVLINEESGSIVMLADGKADVDSKGNAIFTNVGQIDAKDWFIVGCGDYNNDQKDDLLVRQISTGMLGYYSTGDMDKWVELGRGVDSNWTVIA